MAHSLCKKTISSFLLSTIYLKEMSSINHVILSCDCHVISDLNLFPCKIWLYTIMSIRPISMPLRSRYLHVGRMHHNFIGGRRGRGRGGGEREGGERKE